MKTPTIYASKYSATIETRALLQQGLLRLTSSNRICCIYLSALIWVAVILLSACSVDTAPAGSPKQSSTQPSTHVINDPPAKILDVAQTRESATEPAKASVRHQGIDISHHNGKVDWQMVKTEGIDFVFIKATQGTHYIDPMFVSNWEQSRLQKLHRGAYHFFIPTTDVSRQIDNFATLIEKDVGELPPVVDVEQYREEYKSTGCDIALARLSNFIDGVEQRTGHHVMIYTNSATWNKLLCGDDRFGHLPLWIAEYDRPADAKHPRMPNGWTRWTFWQYSPNSSVRGIAGSVDSSIANGDIEMLRATRIVTDR